MTIHAKIEMASRGEKKKFRIIADTDGAGISIKDNTWKICSMGDGDIPNPRPYAGVIVRTRGGGEYLIAEYSTVEEANALMDQIATCIAEGRHYITIDAGKITGAV